MMSSCIALMESVMGPLEDVDPLDIEVAKEERRSEYLEYELTDVVEQDCACEKRYTASSSVGVSGKPSGVGERGLIKSGESSAPMMLRQ